MLADRVRIGSNKPSFVPTDFDNLAIWFDAQSIVANSGNINSWDDSSGNDYHASGGTFSITTFNDKKIVTSNGLTNMKLSRYLPLPEEVSIFFVGRLNSTAVVTQGLKYKILGDTEGTMYTEIGADGGKFGFIQYNDGYKKFLGNEIIGNNQLFIGSIVRGINGFYRITTPNDSIEVESSTAINNSTYYHVNTLCGGYNFTDNRNWNNYIGEIIVYHSRLSITDENRVRNYLKSKWI